MHGGRSLAGAAHPGFKHGRYSKRVPERLADSYREAMTDRELLDLRDEIALIDARIGELLASDPDDDGWDVIGRLIDIRRRLVDGERSRLVETRQMITSEEVMALFAAVVAVVRNHVTDRDTLMAISSEIGQLTDRDTP